MRTKRTATVFAARQYAALEAAFRLCGEEWEGGHLSIRAYELADMLQKDNPLFDRGRFLSACIRPGGAA